MKNHTSLIRWGTVLAISAPLLAGCLGSTSKKRVDPGPLLTPEIISKMSPMERVEQLPKTLSVADVWANGEIWSRAEEEYNFATLLDPKSAAAWVGLGKARLGLKQPAGAKTAFDTGLKLAKETSQPQHQAAALHGLYNVATDKGKALPLAERAAALYRQAGAPTEAMADLLDNMGMVLSKSGRYADAEIALQEALKFNRDKYRVREVLRNNIVLGNHYGRSKEPAKAVVHYSEALKFLDEFGLSKKDRVMKAIVLGNLGQAQHRLEKYDQALALHKRALKDRQQLKMNDPVAVSLSSIADVYESKGNIPAACEYCQKTVDFTARIATRVNGQEEAKKLKEFNCPAAS